MSKIEPHPEFPFLTKEAGNIVEDYMAAMVAHLKKLDHVEILCPLKKGEEDPDAVDGYIAAVMNSDTAFREMFDEVLGECWRKHL